MNEEKKLRKLYSQFLKFQERILLRDRKLWFGTDKIKIKEKEIKKIFLNYEKESICEFFKKVKDIIFAKNPLEETLAKWSTDIWYPYYFFEFLRKKGIIDLKKDGKVILTEKKFSQIFPKPQLEQEIQKKIEQQLKTKLSLNAPSNYYFKTKIKSYYDQLPISVSSAIFIVSKILEYLPFYRNFLFVGDDDLVSIYLSLADKKIYSLVVDVDEELLAKINEVSRKFGLKIRTKKLNIFTQKKLKENFIGFLTSPVYTFWGARIFIDFGVTQFGRDGGYGFLNLGDEAIGNRYVFLIEFFAKKNLKIEEVIKKRIHYPFTLIHSEDKIIFERYKKFFDQKIIEKSPIISSSLWIFNFVPFRLKRPKKQSIYAYL